MAIQILGLREFPDSKTGKPAKKETFFSKGWRAPSVEDIFKDPELYLRPVPPEERWNLYFTVADCFEERGRKLEKQWIIPFDVDGIEHGKEEAVARTMVEALGLEWGLTGALFSGNGVQVFVGIPVPIESNDEFEPLRIFYRGCCTKINAALDAKGLVGYADPSVWSPARLMRMPNTENRKPGKETRVARILQGNIQPQAFDLKAVSGVVVVEKAQQVSESVLQRFPEPDTKTVLSECEFLKDMARDPVSPDEPVLYAALSIIGRLKPNPKAIAVGIFSDRFGKRNHGGSETDLLAKMEQAVQASGPRTCANINGIWGKCAECKYHKTTLVSPIMIQGPNYIKTEKQGFHEMTTDTMGNPKVGRPVVEDLRRFYDRENTYITMADSTIVYKWAKTHWIEVETAELKGFAYDHFRPYPNSKLMGEFVSAIHCTNLRSPAWFSDSISRRMNFLNGVLNIDTGVLEPHNPNFGFRSVLPFNYDADAVAPRFAQFLSEVTMGRQELSDILLEYMGYALSNDECWEHKALLLLGEGRNGKSTFMDVLRWLAGKDAYSALTLNQMKNEAMLYQLDGKLFNMAEETSTTSLIDSSVFKNLVAGGEVLIKKLWKQPYNIINRAKLIAACNELPRSMDKTNALYARMLVIPFDATFTGEKADKHLREKLRQELAGIMNMALEGYKRLHKQRGFTESKIVDAKVEDFKLDNDSVRKFLDEEMHVNGDLSKSINCKDLYVAYKHVCETFYGEKPLINGVFYNRLKQLIPDYDLRFTRVTENGERTRKLKGVSLVQESKF